MSEPRNIVLIGLRGSGKTTVARALAQKLGRAAFDSDEWIQRRMKAAVAEIFARLGEPGFRALEHEAIVAALNRNGRVVSVGGGSVVMPENRALLRANAICVWLTASAEVLYERMANDPRTLLTRPALTGLDPLREMQSIEESRAPLYQELADITVNTERRTVAEVVEAVATALRLAPGAAPP